MEDDWFAANVAARDIYNWLDLLRSKVSGYALLKDRKDARDGAGRYHMTVIAPHELEQLEAKRLFPQKDLAGTALALEILGIGCSQQNGAVAYYLVVDSPDAIKLRTKLGLDNTHFHPHITLGFDPKDIHGVDKRQVKWKLG